jgi:hypothetical protein
MLLNAMGFIIPISRRMPRTAVAFLAKKFNQKIMKVTTINSQCEKRNYIARSLKSRQSYNLPFHFVSRFLNRRAEWLCQVEEKN